MTDGLFDAALPPEPSPHPTMVERAFELARGGAYVTIEQIAEQLKAERYEGVDGLLFEASIRTALRQACAEGRQSASRPRGAA
jgi:hypothetical protein